MPAAVLLATGLIAMGYGSWRGYLAARAALVPLLREGDETRTLIESARPLHARTRVRLAARHVLLAIGWLTVAMYGMYLATAGVAVGA